MPVVVSTQPTHIYVCGGDPGAHDRNRTGDLVLTKDVLYRLSYMSIKPSVSISTHSISALSRHLERVMGIEPTPSAWKAEVLPLNYTREALESRRAGAVRLRWSVAPLCLVEGEGFEPS